MLFMIALLKARFSGMADYKKKLLKIFIPLMLSSLISQLQMMIDRIFLGRLDILYMSATPIPRTYALTIYGDMDISMIKTKPSGRKDIITKVFKKDQIKEVLYLMLEEIKKCLYRKNYPNLF